MPVKTMIRDRTIALILSPVHVHRVVYVCANVYVSVYHQIRFVSMFNNIYLKNVGCVVERVLPPCATAHELCIDASQCLSIHFAHQESGETWERASRPCRIHTRTRIDGSMRVDRS
jgi:hypothetical protein